MLGRSPAARSGPSPPPVRIRAGSSGHPGPARRWSGSRPASVKTISRCAPSCASARRSGSSRSARPATATATCGRESGSCRWNATCGSASADSPRGERDRGRVVRLSPTPYGLGLVGRGREAQRRPSRRLEPGQRHQRPARALGAGDLDRRHSQRAGARALRGPRRDRARGRAARVLGPLRTPQGGAAGLRPSPTASRSAASPAPCPAGSSSSRGLGVIEHHDAHW